LTRETVLGKDGRKAEINVYKVGEVEKVEGDKVVKRAKLRFEISYGNTVKECFDDCKEAVKEVAKASGYKISVRALGERVAELREAYGENEEMSIVDYVRQKYPDRLAEIEMDPVKWIMSRTKEIVGYDRLKLLAFLSLVSTRMERMMGMTRIHIMLVGGSGVGKSSTVKSVLKFAGDVVISSTRVTKNALGYLPVDSFDGHVLFIEQIDRQGMNYLRELMTEEKICTVVTEKDVDEDGKERHISRQRCIEGQPAVVTTSVVDDIDVDKEQVFNRMLKVYVRTDPTLENIIWKSIMNRSKVEISPADLVVFRAWLVSRPTHARIPEDVADAVIAFMRKLKDYTREPLNRIVEIARNLIITTAIMRGRTEATLDDWKFVAENFQLDLLYNGLGLTERDVEIIEVIPDDEGMKTQEIADTLKYSKPYVLNLLKNLENKGVVEGIKEDGKTFTWYLTPLGKKIKTLVNDIDGGVFENDEIIAETKFRPDDNGGGGRGDAVPADDGGGVRGDEGENNRVAEAYRILKERGWLLASDLVSWFGEDILEELKKKGLIVFNIIDGVPYVGPK
jgi:DNA-binding MarR family transcriptional regulator